MRQSIKIINGDAFVEMPNMAANSVDMVLTDPPYFLDGLDDKWRKGKINTNKNNVIGSLPVGMKFDKRQGTRFMDFTERIGHEMYRVLKPGGFVLMFSQPRLSPFGGVGLDNAGFEIRDMYSWFYGKGQGKAFKQDHFINRMDITEKEKLRIKQSIGNRKTPQLTPSFEVIIMAQKPREGTFVNNWLKYKIGLVQISKSISTAFMYPKPVKDEFNFHPTVKPVPLCAQLIQIFTNENSVVLDPFMGSGTTGVAARRKKRAFIGIEMYTGYCSIAETRIRVEADT